ncbi:hypothetical protein EDB80DRAFT_783578 [Ilyonectria destructans]|nr:hypothetical protein EDB80DRAFT_783578 [Ilyonectria destructans]
MSTPRCETMSQAGVGGWSAETPSEDDGIFQQPTELGSGPVEELRATHRGVRERWFFDDDDLSSLLKLALAPFQFLYREILTHARISKLFVPEMKASSHYDFTRSKMIDWGIRVRPPPPAFLRIQALVDELPGSQSSVNKTVYGPVTVAAGHRRMSVLLPANQEPIITLPLILIMEHEWSLLFACDRGDRIDIVENVAMGDTRGLIGLYKILAVLRSLASWMQRVFHE